jgi:hypothetical protein
MNCPACGAPLTPDASFCAKCGAPVAPDAPVPKVGPTPPPPVPLPPPTPVAISTTPAAPVATASNEKGRRTGLVVGAAAVVVAGLVAGGIVLATRHDRGTKKSTASGLSHPNALAVVAIGPDDPTVRLVDLKGKDVRDLGPAKSGSVAIVGRYAVAYSEETPGIIDMTTGARQGLDAGQLMRVADDYALWSTRSPFVVTLIDGRTGKLVKGAAGEVLGIDPTGRFVLGVGTSTWFAARETPDDRHDLGPHSIRATIDASGQRLAYLTTNPKAVHLRGPPRRPRTRSSRRHATRRWRSTSWSAASSWSAVTAPSPASRRAAGPPSGRRSCPEGREPTCSPVSDPTPRRRCSASPPTATTSTRVCSSRPTGP